MDNYIESVLDSIKKLLGIDYTDDSFDVDIIIQINSALQNLVQIGVLKSAPLIRDNTTYWTEITNNDATIEQMKMYIYMTIRLIFDPPSSSSAVSSIKEYLKELEYRLYIQKNFLDGGK